MNFKTPENRRISNAKWRKNNPKKMAEASNNWARNNLDARMVTVARARAKKKNIPFNISREDISIPEYCPVLGIKLKSGIGTSAKPGGNWDSPSLDRIVPELGYVKGNVVVISHLANTLKGSATPEQLLRFAEWINNTYDKKTYFNS